MEKVLAMKDRSTEDDLFEVNHHFIEVNQRYWGKKEGIEKSCVASSSRDRRDSYATRGRPVSRGPAVSEPSAEDAPKTSGTAAEASGLGKKLRELKQRLKESKAGKPRDRVLALRDRERRDNEELAASPPRRGVGKGGTDPPPKSDRFESRVRTPSSRSL